MIKVLRNIFKKKRDKEIGYERFVKKTEVHNLLDSFTEKENHYSVIFHILVYVGFRPSEVVSLRLIDFSSDFKTVTRKLSKTGKYKPRPVIEFVAEMIENYVRENISSIAKNKGYLFYTENNNSKHKHIQTSTLRWKLREKRFKLGITDHIIHNKKHYRFEVYSLRRYFITEVVKKTGDIHIAMQIVGHTNPRTTMRYVEKIKIDEKTKILNEVFEDCRQRMTVPIGQTRLQNFT